MLVETRKFLVTSVRLPRGSILIESQRERILTSIKASKEDNLLSGKEQPAEIQANSANITDSSLVPDLHLLLMRL